MILVSMASPINPFVSSPDSNHFINEIDEVRDWLRSPSRRILYIHGVDTLEASEQLFFSIQQYANANLKQHHLILYFSFDRHDNRRNTLSHMLSTFISQVICHRSKDLEPRISLMFEELNQERYWTETDLCIWFRKLQYYSSIVEISIVLSNFHDCSPSSQASILGLLSKMTYGNDLRCLIAIASSQPRIKDHDPRHLEWIDLELKIPQPGHDAFVTSEITTLLRSHPEMSTQRAELKDCLEKIADSDSISGKIIREQWRAQRNLPVGKFHEDTSNLNGFQECNRLAHTLDQLLRNFPDHEKARTLLVWIVFAVRPLTVWELAIAIAIDLEVDRKSTKVVELQSSDVNGLVIQLETWFAGIVQIRHNEVRVANEQIVSVLMGSGNGPTGPYFWNGIRDIAHLRISRACLQYLQDPNIYTVSDQFQGLLACEDIKPSVTLRRYNLVSYATLHWATHYLKHPIPGDLLTDVEAFLESDLCPRWARTFWSLSNPVTRPNKPFETGSPILASLPISHNHIDLVNTAKDETLIEASRNPDSSLALELLERHEWSQSTLLQALIGASASVNEDLAVQIFDLMQRKQLGGRTQWPLMLLRRASRLNFVKLTGRLVKAGGHEQAVLTEDSCDLPPPLFQAAVNNSVDCLILLQESGVDFEQWTRFSRTVLHSTVEFGCTEAAKALLEMYPHMLELEDENGCTALDLAADWGQYDMVECLLELGADPNMRSRDQSTKVDGLNRLPLPSAAKEGHIECVRSLLHHGADPNIVGPDGGDTPLLYAVVHGHTTICRMLLQDKADPNNSLHKSSILVALLTTDDLPPLTVEGIFGLLLEFGADINCIDDSHLTPLVHAIKSCRQSLVEQLLEKGADLNMRCGESCALIFALGEANGLDVMKALVDKDADLENVNPQGISPLGFAAARGNTAAVEFLIDRKAALESECHEPGYYQGWTAVCFAARFGKPEIIRLLANAGADLRHRNIDGACPLHLATISDSLHALLEYRARIDIDETNDSGATPLMVAIQDDGSVENIRLLINAGVNVNIHDSSGRTALMKGVIRNNREIISLLLKHTDIEINLTSSAYGSALHQACRDGNLEIMKLLVESGANVNATVFGYRGTPLQSACQAGDWDDPGTAQLRLEYLLSKGANPTAAGGQFGTLMSTAAAFTPPSIVRFLLNKGAPIEAHNQQGCMPIHFAATHGIDNLLVLMDAGANIEARDKMGRTPLHWAAQNGRLRVVDYILKTSDPSAVQEMDIDGWTPLHWAARGSNGSFFPAFAGEEIDHQGVIKSLLDFGADVDKTVLIEEEAWPPLRLACYSGASVETAKALMPSNRNRVTENEVKTGGDLNWTCDSCYWVIRGPAFFCQTCVDNSLCPKCYMRRNIAHAPYADHEFIQKGEEFAPEDEWQPLLQGLNAKNETESELAFSDSSSDSEFSSSSDRGLRRGRRRRAGI
ncbi:uncharacterized protein N7479_009076 [Penicillium vulpinum]|nr:uncharacterized protein N7479_009076 [Penicillium vulpinum]KAJ5950663.1 hypothetical protein N7479_009076 [Penicillium vulpinum]